MIHTIRPDMLTRAVKVVLVGAGGTGSHVLRRLANIHLAMVELGHPGGLDVAVYDPDTVSHANVGRQNFYPSDIGLSKAAILAHRCNMLLGTDWTGNQVKITGSTSFPNVDVMIGCVDNRQARKAILGAISHSYKPVYWLDTGNRAHDGQAILGQVWSHSYKQKENEIRLPHAADLFPEIIDGDMDDMDDAPSCSLAAALEKQSLFINDTVANAAMNMLWELVRYGQISQHGSFVNIKTGRVSPLAVDPAAWERFGYKVPVEKKKRRSKAAMIPV